MKSGVCTKCGEERVARFRVVPDGAGAAADVPRKLGSYPTGKSAVYGLIAIKAEVMVEAYVCTICGYFEEWVRHPDAIRWDEVDGLEWVVPKEVP